MQNLRVVGYRGGVRSTVKAVKAILDDTDKNFMKQNKVLDTEYYDQDACRDTHHFLEEWERKYENKRADKLTATHPVQRRDTD